MAGWSIAHLASGVVDTLKRQAVADHDRWILWTPVAFGSGILVYFALVDEPAIWIGPGFTLACLVLLYLWRRDIALTMACTAMAIAAGGFTMAKLRSDAVAAPVLQKPVGPLYVEGLVVRFESFPDRPRVMLERIRLDGRRVPEAVPARLLVRLKPDATASVGARIRVLARLLPPPGPVEPGGFDYQRRAWFERIGATGYALGDIREIPGEGISDVATRAALAVGRLRQAMADRIRAALPGTEGALAAALIVGDRSAVPEEVTEALRDSGLAHLLAISGLHIGLVASIIFFAVRALLAVIEPVALRLDARKVAAAAALVASFIYLLISGATLPTQRAFVMGGLVLCALLLDRKAISLRLVAVAALVVLILTPESVLSASFQMSFAAVTALVALYEVLSPRLRGRWKTGIPGRVGFYFLMLAVTTFVAGAATGVIASYHFGRITHYGVIANLLAIPLTALWIMPTAVIASALMPFGADGPALQLMGMGIDLLTALAAEASIWPGAVTLVPAIPANAFLLLVGGGLWLCLMRARWRWAGPMLMVAGVGLVPFAQRPDILVSESGKLVAVRLADGSLAMSTARAEGFAAERWMRSNGQRTAETWQQGALQGREPHCDLQGCIFTSGLHTVAIVQRRAAFAEDCRTASVVISNLWPRRHCGATSTVIARRELLRGGAHAVYLDGPVPRVVSVNAVRGRRPWVPGQERSSTRRR